MSLLRHIKAEKKNAAVAALFAFAALVMVSTLGAVGRYASFDWAVLIVVLAPIAIGVWLLTVGRDALAAAVTRRLQSWQVLWVLIFLSGLVFRVRTSQSIRESALDFWAIYRMVLVAAVAIVLVARLVKPATNWFSTARQGLTAILGIYGLVCIVSSVWSVYPTWTAYKSLEYATDVALMAATIEMLRSQRQATQALDLSYGLVGLLLVTIWLGALFSPQEALNPSRGMIPFQLFGVLPFFSTNIVGELGAIIAIVALSRLIRSSDHNNARVGYFLAFTISTATVILSQTRSAIIAFAVAAILVLVLARPKLGVASLVVGAAAWVAGANFLERFMIRGDNRYALENLNGRLDFWSMGFHAISGHWLRGLGAYAGGRFDVLERLGGATTMHNTYMEVLVGTGIAGLVPVLLVIFGIWYILARALRRTRGTRESYRLIETLGVMAVLTIRSLFDSEMIWHTSVVFFAVVVYAELVRQEHSRYQARPLAKASGQSSRKPHNLARLSAARGWAVRSLCTVSTVALLVSCSGGQKIAPQNVGGGIPGTDFGLTALASVLFPNTSQIWPTVPFGALRLWDSGTSWQELNPSRGTFRFDYIDLWITAAQSHGITDILYTFGRTPQWASSRPASNSCNASNGSNAPPSDLNSDGSGSDQYWKEFVTALVKHAAGRIRVWELWNEPNACGFWTGSKAQLMRMARDAYGIIKNIDPNATVLTPAPAGTVNDPPSNWMATYLAIGGGDYADVIAFHGPDPEGHSAIAENIVPIANQMKSVMAEYGQDGKALWDTEGSWGTSVNAPDPPAQAAFLARFYILHWSEGVARFYWYGWNHPSVGTLWDKQSGLHQSGIAYRQVRAWLVGATMSTPCSESETGIWSCRLSRPNAYQGVLVWAPDGTTIFDASLFRSVHELSGNVISANANTRIGPSPVLIDTQPPNQ